LQGLLLLVAPLMAAPVSAQPDLDAVRAAVKLANSPAVWSEALRRGDPSPLANAWAGEPLAYFSAEVVDYRTRGLRMLSTLEALEFLDVRLLDERSATADTREAWFDLLCTDAGELRGVRRSETRDRYELVWQEGTWWVSGVEIALLDGSFDWTPAVDPPDAPSPCEAVLAVHTAAAPAAP
jgi:hypothetical protein